jgi:hypothetical protein
MHMSLREQWRLNARFFAGSRASASSYLHKLEQQQTRPSPPSPIIVPTSLALSASPKAIMRDGHGAWAVTGSAQVTDVPCETQGTSELPRVSQGSLAGASPHAPDPQRRERRKRRSAARKNFTIRMSDDIRAKLAAKAAAAESYPSVYVLKLIAADLCLPVDEAQIARSRGLQEQ